MAPSDEELVVVAGEFAQKYPPLITLEQAAAIAQAPLSTLYDWSHRNRLDAFKSRRGRHVLLRRDAYVRWLTGTSN